MVVAEEEGFAAAARRLRISPPSVTRAIAAMEERIGTQLLSRTTRNVHLTEVGQRYLEDCRRILGELEVLSHWRFMDEANSLSLRVDPRLVVTANQAAINIARQGWGVTRVLSYQVARQVAEGELEVVLKAFEPPALPIHVVYQKSNRVPAKVHTFVDFLADRLGDDVTLKPVVKGTG